MDDLGLFLCNGLAVVYLENKTIWYKSERGKPMIISRFVNVKYWFGGDRPLIF
jgi:hypothetical protein